MAAVAARPGHDETGEDRATVVGAARPGSPTSLRALTMTTREKPHPIAGLGIVRSFQIIELF